jgi:hypothetical protein
VPLGHAGISEGAISEGTPAKVATTYQPPAYDAVTFDFTETPYTAPSYGAVSFDFGGSASTQVPRNRKPRQWQSGSRRGNSYKRP